MKSLLSISLLSILLSVCNGNKEKKQDLDNTEASERIDPAQLPEENEIISADEPAVDEAVDAAESKPGSTKPKYEGEFPDTSEKKVIEHGAPDKARNDSVKAAKTKGKF